jgi:hypothetical protein
MRLPKIERSADIQPHFTDRDKGRRIPGSEALAKSPGRPKYLSGFDFRYNAREVSHVERWDIPLAGIGGKRLEYRDSCESRTA